MSNYTDCNWRSRHRSIVANRFTDWNPTKTGPFARYFHQPSLGCSTPECDSIRRQNLDRKVSFANDGNGSHGLKERIILGKPRVLLAAAKWWPLSARLAIALHRHGCDVQAVCPVWTSNDARIQYSAYLYYEGIFSLSSLRRAVRDCSPDIVIPCDDGVVLQLHAIHELDPSLRPVIERSLGPPENYSVVESRHQFLSAAVDLGIRVPRMRKIEKAEDLMAWHRDLGSASVLKVDGESGGNGVRISQSLDESVAAWRELHAPCSRATAWKRLIIDRDPLPLWLRRRQSSREVTVQEFIPGRPANSMLVCWRGELLSLVSVVVVAAEGPDGRCNNCPRDRK